MISYVNVYLRSCMHASYTEVIEVVMGQHNSTDENSDDTTEVEVLGSHIAKNTKEIGDDYLGDFTVD